MTLKASLEVSGPFPPREPLPTAPHLKQRTGNLPGQRSVTQAGRTQQQNKRPPIESPASPSAGSDALAVVPQSQSEEGAAEGGE